MCINVKNFVIVSTKAALLRVIIVRLLLKIGLKTYKYLSYFMKKEKLKRIIRPEGCELRVNRSIQVERAIAEQI
ncbi:hypothetical protein [Clostridioides difficile]|uniref:hypothetical protein n=1 Tax=Clostridioides difficile TaxID=1496 RepID=UPI0019253701|nr:hypothetical protein [Clostridioides difficile]MCE4884990.1 hypothetical protein [Clostridioides difficile]MCI4802141.1 hypothetical protein [Clostridioides difficile]MCR1735867.1 hypothetical protein [Clostridioides difficile]MCZ8460322.1 hypothetical protein [Clostridioides difficile]MDE3577733.1 hypothetical protein [Clostridioides difficile]